MEQILNEIGQLLAEDRADPLHHILLHAELDRNFVAPSIFEDVGGQILYRDANIPLQDALLDLWEAQEAKKRWIEIEYVMQGDRFSASFAYPEDIDPEVDRLDRRDHIVEKHLGKKPIIYSPPPDDAMDYKL